MKIPFVGLCAILVCCGPAMGQSVEIKVASGLAAFDVPQEWLSPKNEKFQLIIDSHKTGEDVRTLASCSVDAYVFDNPAGYNQAMANLQTAAMSAEVMAHPFDDGETTSYSSSIVSGVRVVDSVIDVGKKNMAVTQRRLSIVEGARTHAVVIVCINALTSDEDLEPERARFLNSMRLKPRG